MVDQFGPAARPGGGTRNMANNFTFGTTLLGWCGVADKTMPTTRQQHDEQQSDQPWPPPMSRDRGSRHCASRLCRCRQKNICLSLRPQAPWWWTFKKKLVQLAWERGYTTRICMWGFIGCCGFGLQHLAFAPCKMQSPPLTLTAPLAHPSWCNISSLRDAYVKLRPL